MVKTSKGEFRAKQYVLAGGAWSQDLVRSLGLKLPIQPAKGYSITFDRTPDMFSTPMILTERKVAITPLGDKVRYGGTLELAGFDSSINMRRVQAIADARSRMPQKSTDFYPKLPTGMTIYDVTV